MDPRHAQPPADAHTRAHEGVVCTRMDTTLSDDARRLVDAARSCRAEAERLEAGARAKRAEMARIMAELRRTGLSNRAVARLLDYRSENSVRRKTRTTIS